MKFVRFHFPHHGGAIFRKNAINSKVVSYLASISNYPEHLDLTLVYSMPLELLLLPFRVLNPYITQAGSATTASASRQDKRNLRHFNEMLFMHLIEEVIDVSSL